MRVRWSTNSNAGNGWTRTVPVTAPELCANAEVRRVAALAQRGTRTAFDTGAIQSEICCRVKR